MTLWTLLTTNLTEAVGDLSPLATGLLIVAGLIALFAGRRFAWVFTALLGFLLGIWAGPLVATNALPGWLHQTVVLMFAVLAAFLGLAAHRPAAVVIGALAFAGLGDALAGAMGWGGWAEWAAIGGGALLGILLMARGRESTLMAISAVYGALVTVLALRVVWPQMAPAVEIGLVALLLLLGLAYQIVDYRRTVDFVVPPAAGGLPPRKPKAR